jgi:hypothetical protein
MDAEVKIANLPEVLKHALSLEIRDRATLAERLLASLEEITEEEVEHLGQRKRHHQHSSTDSDASRQFMWWEQD